MGQPRFINTITGRMLLFGVIPTMLFIAAIVAWSALDEYRRARKAQEQVLAADASGAAAELSVRNDRWNSTAHMVALSQVDGLFGKRKESLAFVKAVNEISDLNLSVYVVYEPNADGQDAQSLKAGDIPTEAMDASGRFVPVCYDIYQAGARTGQTGLKQSVGMESLDYYLVPKAEFAKTGKPASVLTEPYVKEGQTLLSHVYPIVIQGKFMGIAGVNRSLDVLTNIATAIKNRSAADVFILSPRGQFIAATSDVGKSAGEMLKDKSISETPFAPVASRWQSTGMGGAAAIFELVDPVLNERCMYAAARVGVGGWTVVTRRVTSDVMKEANSAVLRNIILGGIGIILVGGLLRFVTVRAAGRIRRAADAADRIAHGDLTRAIDEADSPDESGQLMRSMRSMDEKLNSLVGNVKQAGIRLNSTATEIAATSKQQEASSATFGAASNQIAAAVKEISATGHDLVKTMDSVNRIAGETAVLAGSGQSSLQNMEAVMRDLDGGTASIADKLNAINERSQKITTVITTITKVADQTNILSINAAIEAEKAGEYGAGFLVIAREIRRLADQTASATLDIEQMVQQMQGAVSSGVMEMDRFSDQVRRGVREVASAGAQLNEIIDRVNRSTDSFKQVNESMQAQSEGAQQISDAMASLVSNANQTVQSVKEFSRAAADLQSAISLLREAVSRFKLRE
jgi:methyl-accepting chemotaxis protein